MYFNDLTRNSFESGLSATKWLALCKLLVANKPPIQLESAGQAAINISNSILVLYRSYPGDPSLQDYLKTAIQDGLLPLSTFVSTLLQAARSSDLHIPVTLDTLCQIALDIYYSSGKLPIGSIVPLDNSLSDTVNTLVDAIALLRTAHSLPISHFHRVTTSVNNLVGLLMMCIPDFSAIPPDQAMHLLRESSFVSSTSQLIPEARETLDTIVVRLSYLIDSDKVSRDAQLMHTAQHSMAKGDVLGPNSESDMISLGLLLNYMVTNRAYPFGAADGQNAAALLLSNFRWSSWTPTVFYTQLLISAFTCLSQAGSNTGVWKAFLVGRLPELLGIFSPEIVKTESIANVNQDAPLLAGLKALFQRYDILVPGNNLAKDITSEAPEDNSTRSLSREFLQQLIKYNLLSPSEAAQLDPMVSNEQLPKWHIEAHDMGLDVAAYLELKLLQDSGADNDSQTWVDKFVKDAAIHSAFSKHIFMRFETSGKSLDVDTLGPLCKLLHTHESILDIVALHEPISDLIFHSAVLVEDYDCETVGDPQTAVSHFGNVVLFIQFATIRFKFDAKDMSKNNRTITLGYLLHDWAIRLIDRPQEMLRAISNWYGNLFNKDSEGIEDSMLRTTKPKTLLQITPGLFTFVTTKKVEKDAVMNGISYFNGPLLNWTLVGAIKALVKEIPMKGTGATLHYEIIQALLLSPACPKCVLAICSPQINTILQDKRRPIQVPKSFDISAVRVTLANAIGSAVEDFAIPPSGSFWYPHVQQSLQKTFFMARTNKAPYLDIRRCLNIAPPIKFLQLFWTELRTAANQRELEACRRVATFVLATPQGRSIPPLLPIFLHVVLPTLIASADMQPSEQDMTVDLMIAVVSSALNATLQLELSQIAMKADDDEPLLGESSTAMARRLAFDLRASRRSHVSNTILHRLSSSPAFVGSFSMFKIDGA